MSEPILDTIKFTRLKSFIEQVEKQYKGDIEELEISFECLVGSFYPKVWQNMQAALAHEHTLGYIEGRESLNEN